MLFAACGGSILRYRAKRFADWFTCSVYATTGLVMGARCVSVLPYRGTLTLTNDTSKRVVVATLDPLGLWRLMAPCR